MSQATGASGLSFLLRSWTIGLKMLALFFLFGQPNMKGHSSMKSIVKNVAWISILKLAVILILLGSFIYFLCPKYKFIRGKIRMNVFTGETHLLINNHWKRIKEN